MYKKELKGKNNCTEVFALKKIILKAAKKQKNEKSGKTFYTVLFIAIVLVGTTGYIMRMQNNAISELSESGIEKISVSVPQTATHLMTASDSQIPSEQVPVSTVPEESWQSDDVLPVTEEFPTEDSVAVTAENLNTQDDTQTKTNLTPEITSLLAPVSGEIIKNHSDTELAYSKTMEDWRLHKGEDIKGSIGTTVVAAADGVVSECYEDTAYGVTIIIDHGNGLFTKYSNLASYDMVYTDKEVSAGDAIGVVGDTAEFEIADEAHLHFEVIKDGRSVNPSDYIKR